MALIIGLATTACGWVAPTSLAASDNTETENLDTKTVSQPRTITVVGEGSVNIEPDLARATIGVETVGDTVEEATSQSAETMEKLLAALKDQGIAEKDIQTSGYSLWTDRSYSEPSQPKSETELTYRVNNTVNVVIRDLDKLGAVLDAGIGTGANSIHSVHFSVDEPRELAWEARKEAIADAEAKAQHLAELNDVNVGPVVSVSEVVGSGGGYYSSNFSAENALMSSGYGGGAGPISPGELELSLKLEVVYAIE